MRQRARRLVESSPFQWTIIRVILVNAVVLVSALEARLPQR